MALAVVDPSKLDQTIQKSKSSFFRVIFRGFHVIRPPEEGQVAIAVINFLCFTYARRIDVQTRQPRLCANLQRVGGKVNHSYVRHKITSTVEVRAHNHDWSPTSTRSKSTASYAVKGKQQIVAIHSQEAILYMLTKTTIENLSVD